MPYATQSKRLAAARRRRALKANKSAEQDNPPEDQEDEDQSHEESSSAAASISITNSTSRHPASSATATTTTNTNASEDSNTNSRRRNSGITTTSSNVNNVRVNISGSANVNIGGGSSGITTRRSTTLSQQQKSSGTAVASAVIDDPINLGQLTLKKKEEDEEEQLNKSTTSSEEEDPSNLVVIKSVEPPPGRSEEGDDEQSTGSSPTATGGSSEEDVEQSYVILVNPDGSLTLVDGTRPTELEPGQEQFKVTLPKSKVKSPNNPLPGAVLLPAQGGRNRKSKPEGTTYGSSSASNSEVKQGASTSGTKATMSVGINQAHTSVLSSNTGVSSSVPIDIDEFTNQLDEQSLATLDSLIQSQQAREIIENLDLEHQQVGIHPLNVNVPESGGDTNKWDNSHHHNQNMGSLSESASMTGSSAENSPAPFRGGGGKGSAGGGKGGGGGGGGGGGRTRTSTSSRVSESGDSGNIRRSQRQQDRIERQEAERIMAENQQMLQREKEIMLGAASPKPPIPTLVAVSKKVDTPVASPTMTPPVGVGTPQPKPANVSYRDRESIDSSGSDRKPYPKRENRRLPAHLADPNYVGLGDEGDAKAHRSDDDVVLLSEEGDDVLDASYASENLDNDYEPESQETSMDDGDEEYTEDDPNKLWCICQQPHNNRFMICCDTCEEWFHGKCVGVTKAQGKAMELKNILWICPPCKKASIEKKKNAKAAERAIHTARRSSAAGSAGVSNDAGRKVSKGAAALQADAAAAAVASKMAFMPNSSRKGSSSSPQKRGESRQDKYDEHEKGPGCVVCGKPTRVDSIYCSDPCVRKHADVIGSKTSPTDASSASSSPNKLKRANSKPDGKPGEPIFNFHVINSGTSKSTEIAPPKTKELTASQILKAQKEAQSPTKGGNTSQVSVVGVSPNSVTAIISSKPSVIVKKMSSEKDDKGSSKSRTRTASQSDNRNKSTSNSNRKSEGTKNKEKEFKDTGSSEKLHRENMRKGLREILKTRMKELPEEDRDKLNDGPNNPEALAGKIEEELYKTYGGVNNVKCKNKYRCIYFNLKADKNLMYKELLQGSLKPRVLVKMEAQEMASADLVEWRKNEAEKEIEAIKKAELDKIAESKKQQLIEKGVDDAVKVAEELRAMDISEVIDQTQSSAGTEEKDVSKESHPHTKEKSRHHSSSTSKSHHHGHSSSSSSRRDRDKDSKSHHSRDSANKRDKDRRSTRSSSDRHKDKEPSSSSHRDKDRRSESHRDKERSKDKVKNSESNKITEIKKHGKDSESNSQVSSGSGSEDQQSKSSPEVGAVGVEPKPTPPSDETSPSSTPEVSSDVVSSTPKSAEMDFEVEQPSSTIKTPDFVEDGVKKDTESKHLFQTKVVMPELGSFHASAHGVSHHAVDGLFFPKSPVPVVGRISPDTVWDYINKMKKSKEVIVFRLSPASPADSEGYMTFFSYFSSRSRLGVIGGIESPLKDVYLVPLPKQAPVPRCLLPFRGGPGLPAERTHCLLCIVTRNVRDPVAGVGLKRKSSLMADQPLQAKKRVKIDSDSEVAVPTSSSAGMKSLPVNQQKGSKTDAKKVDDDDAPYTPWEEDESGSSSNNSDSQPPVLTPEILLPKPGQTDAEVQRQLAELEAKIAREKQDIEKITGALAGRSSMSGIPGLDGEFEESEPMQVEENSSSPPEIVAITPPQSTAASVPESEQVSDPRLRRSQRYGNGGAGGVTTTPTKIAPALKPLSEVDGSKVIPKVASPEVMEITRSSSEDSLSKDGPDVVDAGEEKESEESEAYSPSAMQFSDEDNTSSSNSQQEKKDLEKASLLENKDSASDSVTAEPIVEEKSTLPQNVEPVAIPPTPVTEEILIQDDDEPLPPGIDSLAAPAAPIIKPIVHADDIKITWPTKAGAAVVPSPIAQKQSVVDLNNDFQPMRSLAKQGAETKKPESIFEKASVSATNVLPPIKGLSLQGPSSGGSKMKININLTTKQLPTSTIESSIMEESSAISPTTLPSSIPLSSQLPQISQQQPQHPPYFNLHDPRPQLHQNAIVPSPTTGPPPQTIPVHIPPPNLLPASTVSPPNPSVVINLNVPPPSFMMSQRPPVAPGFPPVGFPSRPFTSAPPPPPHISSLPSVTQPPPRMEAGPGFMPSFGQNMNTPTPAGPTTGNFPGQATSSSNRSFKMDTGRSVDLEHSDDHFDHRPVQRVNLDSRGSAGRDRGFRGRERETRRRNSRDRSERDNFGGRRRIERSPVQRIRRRRSGSKSGDRSRSRSPVRDRRNRNRKRTRSRSKSPLSRRWEARNRSRSRSAERRGRNKSRTPSPRSRMKRSRSNSPRRGGSFSNPTRNRGRSPPPKLSSPPSPLIRQSKIAESNKSQQESDEDWESENVESTPGPETAQAPVSNTNEEHSVIPNFD